MLQRLSTVLLLSLVLALGLVTGCSDNDDDASDDDAGDDDTGDEPAALALDAVEPSSGGASVTTRVTLSGAGFAQGMTVQVGEIFAGDVVVESDERMSADFPPVPATDCGPRTVTIKLDEQNASLPDAFGYDFDEDPIVFVHGYTGNGKDWKKMIGWFTELGYPENYLAAISFSENKGSNVVNARDELGPFVDAILAATGAEKVDMLSHSMGGLSSRLYIKSFGGEHKVRDYISLAAAHHGSLIAILFPRGDGAREMYPAYADQEQSVNGVQWDLNGDPEAPDVDETPFGVEDGGEVYWQGALYSDVDLIVAPGSSGCLNQQYRNDCSDPVNLEISGVVHGQMPNDAEVFEIVADRLRAHNMSKP